MSTDAGVARAVRVTLWWWRRFGFGRGVDVERYLDAFVWRDFVIKSESVCFGVGQVD